MKRLLCLTILSLPLLLMAQDSVPINGIKWTTGLSWEQVKQKAKLENKYIFLDVFTTWCGPCKMMDNQIYPNESVGSFFNKKFISVKVQSDKTAKDNEYIKSWYDDATAINRQYQVEGYPAFIFLSPEGKIVEKSVGAILDPQRFITVATIATKPGKVYDDPEKEYDLLTEEFDKGNINYNKLPFMIQKATDRFDSTKRARFMMAHVEYVSSLTPELRYTWSNINFWASLTLSSKKKLFHFFYADGNQIDKVMNRKGYAADVIDKTIQNEIVDSFYSMQKGETTLINGKKIKNSEVMFGMYMLRIDGKQGEPDYAEADWKSLKKAIKKQFNKECAKRVVLNARIQWYERHQNKNLALKLGLIQMGKYPPDLRNYILINGRAWDAFLYATDMKVLNGYISWIKKIVEKYPNRADHIDTYANLLYKTGKYQEAIQWQEKACKLSPTDAEKKDALQKMKNGEPTYLKQGALWDGISISKK